MLQSLVMGMVVVRTGEIQQSSQRPEFEKSVPVVRRTKVKSEDKWCRISVEASSCAVDVADKHSHYILTRLVVAMVAGVTTHTGTQPAGDEFSHAKLGLLTAQTVDTGARTTEIQGIKEGCGPESAPRHY